MRNAKMKHVELVQDNSKNSFRTEKDFLGQSKIPSDVLYGIHTVRAIENFPISYRMAHPSIIRAFGQVKLAAAQTSRALGIWKDNDAKADAIEAACQEMIDGKLDKHIVVDSYQGGAGTSMNMNANEVLANRAIQILGGTLGDSTCVSALDDINVHQSTNDSYPTALKIAVVEQLRVLDVALGRLTDSFNNKAKEFAHVIKIGRTQLQDAVPVSLGQEMAAYACAFARAQKHVIDVQKSLYAVNLGGTAIGTGIAAPAEYILNVAKTLSKVTGIDFVRADDLVDNTQNADAFVEVSARLKVCAVSFIKICTDLRLMASGPEAGFGEIKLPARQAGSSIMPGKVNPVIPEAATQAAMRMIGVDAEVAMAASMGNLELNPFEPLMADSLLNGIDLLARAADMLREKCVDGITANEERCRAEVEGSTALVTSLVSTLGYDKASELAYRAKTEKKTVREVVMDEALMSEAAFDALIEPRTSFH